MNPVFMLLSFGLLSAPSVTLAQQTPAYTQLFGHLGNDFTYKKAEEKCEKLNYRLPTVAELKKIFQASLDSNGHSNLLPPDHYASYYWTTEREFAVDTYTDSPYIPFPWNYHVVLKLYAPDRTNYVKKETHWFGILLPRSEQRREPSEATAFSLCIHSPPEKYKYRDNGAPINDYRSIKNDTKVVDLVSSMQAGGTMGNLPGINQAGLQLLGDFPFKKGDQVILVGNQCTIKTRWEPRKNGTVKKGTAFGFTDSDIVKTSSGFARVAVNDREGSIILECSDKNITTQELFDDFSGRVRVIKKWIL